LEKQSHLPACGQHSGDFARFPGWSADNLAVRDAAAFLKGGGDLNRRERCAFGASASRERDDAPIRFHGNRIGGDSLVLAQSFLNLRTQQNVSIHRRSLAQSSDVLEEAELTGRYLI
jgi:hypothetical protein